MCKAYYLRTVVASNINHGYCLELSIPEAEPYCTYRIIITIYK